MHNFFRKIEHFFLSSVTFNNSDIIIFINCDLEPQGMKSVRESKEMLVLVREKGDNTFTFARCGEWR